MNWTDYLTHKLKEHRSNVHTEKSERDRREAHFTAITAQSIALIKKACEANNIQMRTHEEAGTNIWIGDHHFRMHLVWKQTEIQPARDQEQNDFRMHLVWKRTEMEITVYLYGGSRNTTNLPHITNLTHITAADGTADVLKLTADDVCRYLLDQYLGLVTVPR